MLLRLFIFAKVKKLDRLILRSFIPPFIATFFITLFVFLMQFVWKYIDDIAGKDLGTIVIAKLLFYTSASLVPLSLPLACLLASIMTMGNLAEHHELTAFKAAGISLFRFMRSIIFAGFALSLLAFLFNNYIIPIANLKSGTLLYDVRNSRPAFSIKEGIFYKGIEGYAIKVGSKEKDGKTIHDIMIYDHTSGRGDDNIIVAKDGELASSDNKMFLILTLKNGSHYQEMIPKNNEQAEFLRSDFKSYKKYFDLSGFKMERTNESIFKNNFEMLNLKQINAQLDSVYGKRLTYYSQLYLLIQRFYHFEKLPDSNLVAVKSKPLNTDFYHSLATKNRIKIAERAFASAQEVRTYIDNSNRDLEFSIINEAKYFIEANHKFSYSAACLLLIMLGAALGAVIQKGGLGMPLVMAVVFFVIFHVSNMTGQKFAESLKIPVWLGCWLPLIVLSPIAAYVINKAMKDALIFISFNYRSIMGRYSFVKRIINIFNQFAKHT